MWRALRSPQQIDCPNLTRGTGRKIAGRMPARRSRRRHRAQARRQGRLGSEIIFCGARLALAVMIEVSGRKDAGKMPALRFTSCR
jgi:hypothetical protein